MSTRSGRRVLANTLDQIVSLAEKRLPGLLHGELHFLFARFKIVKLKFYLCLYFFNSRWAVKEAAFKALPNHLVQFSWHDAFLSKVNKRPTLIQTTQVEKAWREAGLGNVFPCLHVSITHDGDYLTAFVVAESSSSSNP